MKFPKQESGFSPCPAGTYLGICFRVIDLGTQLTSYQGVQQPRHQLLVSWEIPDERMDDGRPYTINQKYNFSRHEKSGLRKMLESWRGVKFTESELDTFDIKSIVGRACTLTIIHNEKEGQIYSNVASVGKVLKGVSVPSLSNEKIFLSLGDDDRFEQAVFDKLSDKLKQTISASPEYHERIRPAPANAQAAAPQPAAVGRHTPLPANTIDDMNGDDIPF